ncbi:GEVED domain-containing protein [Streptococcus pneumoniae]
MSYQKKDRFSIRKFKIGVGSVFLGSFLLVTPQIQALENAEVVEAKPAIEVVSNGDATISTVGDSTETVVTEQTSTDEAKSVEEVPKADEAKSVEEAPKAEEAKPVEEAPKAEEAKSVEEVSKTDETKPVAEEVKVEETLKVKSTKPVEAKLAEKVVSSKEEVAKLAEIAVVSERVAATTYKVTYTNQESGDVVYASNHSVSEKTTLPQEEAVEFHISVDAKTDLKVQPALQGYKLAENQAEVQAAVVVERGGRKNLVNINVVRDDQAAAGNNDTEAYTGFRSLPTEKTEGEYNYTTSQAQNSQVFKEEAKKDHANLIKQLTWLDWGDPTAAHNLKTVGNQQALQVGSYFEKEIFPGYVVRVEVTGLKPFRASETYRQRVEGTDAESTYDPNAINNTLGDKNAPKEVLVLPQGFYSAAAKVGINAGAKPTVGTNVNGADVGVQFSVKATYLGREVPSAIFMTTGEEAGGGEIEMYVADGEPFELLGELSNANTKGSYYPLTFDSSLYFLKDKAATGANPVDVRLEYLANVNPEASRITLEGRKDRTGTIGDFRTGDGIGTNVFGPVATSQNNRSLPIVISRNAKNAEVYIMTSGQQSLMLGVIAFDEGDAPESYGAASHIISDKVSQPYLGSRKADLDIAAEDAPKERFKTDDLFNEADEGARQLVGDAEVHVTASGEETYKLHKADESTYTLKIKASPNANAEAFVYAWADFNNDGKFDDSERSELLTVNAQGDYDLTWNNVPQMVDPSVRKVAIRTRIALNQFDIEKPTGIAYTGEVEDFEVQVTHPPRGDKETSKGYVGEKQTMNIEFRVGGTNPVVDTSDNGRIEFTAYGRQEYDFDQDNIIEDTAEVKIVDPSGNLVDTWTEPGQGTYVVTGKTITFTPEVSFTGTAKGVALRVTDKNKATTAWTAADVNASEIELPNINDGSHTYTTPSMDAVYIPTVINNKPKGENKETSDYVDVPQTQNALEMFKEYTVDDQGNPTETVTDKEALNKDSLTLIDASGSPATTVTVVEGTYTLSDGVITFTPNKGYEGTATSVTVRIADTSGDEATATYTPTVINNKPKGENKETSDYVDVPQTQNALEMFKEYTVDDQGNPTETVTDKEALNKDSLTLLDASGAPATTVTVAEGMYTLADGVITFTPNKGYEGTATSVTVRIADTSGDEATATYTPTVINNKPKGTPAETKGPQGIAQTTDAKAMFKEYTTDAQGNPTTTETDKEKLDMTSLTLLDASGNPTKTVTVDGEGTYTLGEDGIITFQPIGSFTGTVKNPVRVRISDASGDEAETTYTPTVDPITPTADPSKTSGIQGATQTSPIVFGDDSQPNSVNFKEGASTAPIDPASVKLLDANGQAVTKTDALDEKGNVIGSYELKDGAIIFTPDATFVGTPQPAKLQATDKNGTKVETTYTPTVTEVTPTGKDTTSTGVQGQTQEGTPSFEGGDVAVPVTISSDNPAKFIDPTTGKETDATELPALKDGKQVGTYTLDPATGKVTFTPNPDFVGTPDAITVQAKDANGTPATATYTPTVTEVIPTGKDTTSTGVQGQTQEGTPSFEGGDVAVPVTISSDNPAKFIDPTTGKETDATELPALKDGKQVGTYTLDPATGKVTFTPNPDFVGTPDAITVQAKDVNGTPATATYTPTVTEVKPTAEPSATTGLQGAKQSSPITFGEDDSAKTINFKDGDKVVKVDPATVTLLDADGKPASTVEVMKDGKKVGTYEIVDGVVVFTPEKDFVGEAPAVTIQAADANGTAVTTTYTPTVTPVKPTGENTSSVGVQGQEQTGTPTFKPGDDSVPVTISADNPAKLIDPETGKPTDATTIPAMKDGKQVGTYTIDSATGEVTFKPNKDFVGTPDPVTVQATDANGTPATAKYSPTVTEVKPTGEDTTSTGKQGQEQTGTPTFEGGDPAVPVTISAENPAKLIDPETGKPTDATTIPAMKDGKQVGTYTLDPATGEVTFQPNKDFVGTPDPVTVQATDSNGTPVTAKYSPTVEGVTPTGEDATSTGKQGQTQTGTPVFKEGDELVPLSDEPAKLIDPKTGDEVTSVTIPGEGTYIVDEDGNVTFTPDPSFTGDGTGVTVKRTDSNGTPVTAKYTPTVEGVTPTGEDATSTGKQGQEQTGTPVFKEGDELVPLSDEPAKLIDPKTGDEVTSVTIPGEGTYTVDPTGKVTFTPDPSFTGDGTGVTVKRTDKNGTPVTAKYNPTVEGVTPTGEDATSTGKQGQTQTGTPVFKEGDELVPLSDEPAKLIDPKTGDEVTSVTIPGEGTYTVDEDGNVTFTPDPSFTGEGSGVEVKRTDSNGTPVTAKYTPTVEGVTPTGEDATSTGKQGEEQTGTPVFKEGDELVPLSDEPAKLIDPKTGDEVTSVTIPSEGTYTVDEDGNVTFTPDPSFLGKGSGVEVKRTDKNGTPVTAKYTPTVTPVTPTGENVTSTGKQGEEQEGTPTFKNGDGTPLVPDASNPAKLIDPKTGDEVTSVTIPGEGTYTVDPTGKVTFTPEKDFTGTGTGVTVIAKDKNGTPAKSTYTPGVTPNTPPTGTSPTVTVPQGSTSITDEDLISSVIPNDKEDGTDVTVTIKDNPVDYNVPGTYEVTFVVTDKGGLTTEVKKTVVVTPNTPPTGTSPTVTVPQGSTPITDEDLISSVIPNDKEDGTDVTVTIKDNPVDYNVPGTYEVTFVVTDKGGLTTEVKKTVVVTPNTPPTGTSPTVTVPQGSTPITDEDLISSVIPNDKEDGTDVTVTIKDNPVDYNVPGTYEVTFVVTDKGGLTTEVKKTVVVTPNTPPTGTSPTVTVPQGSTPITDEDLISSVVPNDKEDGTDVTVTIKDNPVDYNVPGTYEVTFVVTDKGGLTTEVKKTVVVTPNTPPTGTSPTITVPQGSTPITDEDLISSVIPNDKEDGTDVTVTIKDNPVNYDVPGVYEVTFEVTDKGGLTTEVKKTVVVTPKPVTPAIPTDPIIVEQDTPITPDDVAKNVKLPDGAKISKVGKIPTTEIPGKQPSVTVTVELPNGDLVDVEVPVFVTPKPVVPNTPPTGTSPAVTVSQGSTPITDEDLISSVIPNDKEDGTDVTVTIKDNPVDYNVPGTYEVTFVVTDKGGLTTEVKKTVVVTPNTPPTGTSPTITVPQGSTPITDEDLISSVIPNDKEDGTDVTVTIKDNPVNYDVPGVYEVTFEVTDKGGLTTEVKKTVVVTPKPVTPAIPTDPIIVEQDTPITPDDVAKNVKLPDGAKISKVGKIPTTEIPGKQPSVTVTVELPNGDLVDVEVPVFVTPKPVVPNTPPTGTSPAVTVSQGSTPISDEDLIASVTPNDKEDGTDVTVTIKDNPVNYDVPGVYEVTFVVTDKGGLTTEVKKTVVVTPKPVTPAIPTDPIIVEQDTPITPDDVAKNVKLPDGAKISKVGKIPTTEIPGKQPSVTVTVELPNGELVEVEVPVFVTPKPVVPNTPPTGTSPTVTVLQGSTPITDEDLIASVILNDKEDGTDVTVMIKDNPVDYNVPGVYEVTFVVTDKGGLTTEVKKTVVVTPKPVTPAIPTDPIIVEQDTPITPDDVAKNVKLPDGAKISKVGKIPTTEIPGKQPSVTVTVELPNGELVEVEVPVFVAPKPQEPGVDVPAEPAKPAAPVIPQAPVSKEVPAQVAEKKMETLPKTGESSSALTLLGALSAGLGLLGVTKRRKKED